MLELKGKSVSGVETCIVVPQYKVVLDIGYCPKEAYSYPTVFITHAHLDHMAGAVKHAAFRSLTGMTPTRFVCSPEVAVHLRRVLELWREIQGDFTYEILPISPESDSLQLHGGLSVKAVPTYHRAPSQGYLLYQTRKPLKALYRDLTGLEIAALVKQGVVVRDVLEVPVLAFLGDTLPEALEHPEVQRAEVVITECTFVGDSISVQEARDRGHTHLSDLVDKLGVYKQVVLTHFSLRHSSSEIEKEINKLSEDVRAKLSLLLSVD